MRARPDYAAQIAALEADLRRLTIALVALGVHAVILVAMFIFAMRDALGYAHATWTAEAYAHVRVLYALAGAVLVPRLISQWAGPHRGAA